MPIRENFSVWLKECNANLFRLERVDKFLKVERHCGLRKRRKFFEMHRCSTKYFSRSIDKVGVAIQIKLSLILYQIDLCEF